MIRGTVLDPTGAAGTGPASTGFIEERPSHGLARGKYPFPAWGIVALGSALVVVGLLYFLWRLRRDRQSPQS